MARNYYPNLSSSTQTVITPVWPCTLMIYSDEPGGFSTTPGTANGYGKVAIEVQRGDGGFERFPGLQFSSETITPLDLPGCAIRVVAEGLSNVTVEIVDSATG